MRLLNADSVQFFAWNRENETCEKRRKFDMVALQTKTYWCFWNEFIVKYVRFECRYSFLWVCCVNLSRSAAKKDLTEKILCGNLWANSLLWNKVEFESACIILVCGKGESIFIAGRIANKTQFLRPNRCVAAERTTKYELWQSASRQQNPWKPPRKKAGRRNGLQQKLKFQCSSFAHWKKDSAIWE